MRNRPSLSGYTMLFALLIAALFPLSSSASAQDTGAIAGKVTGDGRTPLENVVVVLYEPVNFTGSIFLQEMAQGLTDANGDYLVTGLAGGAYALALSRPTIRVTISNNIILLPPRLRMPPM